MLPKNQFSRELAESVDLEVKDYTQWPAGEDIVHINTLPNVDRAVIDPRLLIEYALNLDHPAGGNTAKVFESALSYNKSNADDLIKQIYNNLPNIEAVLGTLDEYG